MSPLLQTAIGVTIAAIFVAGLIAWGEQIETWWREWRHRPQK